MCRQLINSWVHILGSVVKLLLSNGSKYFVRCYWDVESTTLSVIGEIIGDVYNSSVKIVFWLDCNVVR